MKLSLRIRKAFFAIGAISALSAMAHADHGSCTCARSDLDGPPEKIFEPAQRAIIVWNGEVEQLILSTDIASSAPSAGKIAEFIPLPNKPEVSSESPDIFERLVAIDPSSSTSWNALVPRNPIGKLIGEGPIKQLERSQELTVELGRLCRLHPAYIAPVRDIAERYRRRGIAWFATDQIEVQGDVHSYPPIVYEFASRHLYYPLETSILASGRTQIDLLVITPHGVNGLRPTSTPITVMSTSEVETASLGKVRTDWPQFLRVETAIVQHIRMEGWLSEMRLDFATD